MTIKFWKDLEKTIPCKDGDPCAVMEGFQGDWEQSALPRRPIYRETGLEFDGVDDKLNKQRKGDF
jgi:hypothetical protein